MDLSTKTDRLNPGIVSELARAAEILRSGGTVAFPTETVYGLGANALDPAAVARIFAAKQRPAWDPLIVHVSNSTMLATVAAVSPLAQRLIDRFWPGPLSLLLPRTPAIPDAVTAGRPLVGVRMPAHPVALALLDAARVPVAAPSANRFGHTSPTSARHVLDDLDGRIDAVLDGGSTDVGVESTVVGLETVLGVTGTDLIIYRPGGVSLESLEEIVGVGHVHSYVPKLHDLDNDSSPASLPSPGVGIRHYAPRARLLLVHGVEPEANWDEALEARQAAGTSFGVMLPHGWNPGHAAAAYDWGHWPEGDTLARRLFAGLRELDEAGVDVILCPVPEMGGIGEALRDRLEKASRTR